MNDIGAMRARIRELEAEVAAHRRAAMMIFLEYGQQRPQERPHLIALLRDLVQHMGPEAASVSNLLIKELQAAPAQTRREN